MYHGCDGVDVVRTFPGARCVLDTRSSSSGRTALDQRMQTIRICHSRERLYQSQGC